MDEEQLSTEEDASKEFVFGKEFYTEAEILKADDFGIMQDEVINVGVDIYKKYGYSCSLVLETGLGKIRSSMNDTKILGGLVGRIADVLKIGDNVEEINMADIKGLCNIVIDGIDGTPIGIGGLYSNKFIVFEELTKFLLAEDDEALAMSKKKLSAENSEDEESVVPVF